MMTLSVSTQFKSAESRLLLYVKQMIDELEKYKTALENIALLDDADGHTLTVDDAFRAVAIAGSALGKHPSQIFAERWQKDPSS